MSPEEFMKAVEAPALEGRVVSRDLQSAAEVVLASKFISYFTSRDRLSRRYSRELPIFHLWGTVFLHSSWLNDVSMLRLISSKALAENSPLRLEATSRR